MTALENWQHATKNHHHRTFILNKESPNGGTFKLSQVLLVALGFLQVVGLPIKQRLLGIEPQPILVISLSAHLTRSSTTYGHLITFN